MDKYSKIISFVDKQIRENARKTAHGYYLSLSDLDSSDIQELALLFFEYDDRDMCCITENNNDLPSMLVSLLRNDSKENKIIFSDSIASSIVDFYTKNMKEVIDERLGWVQQEDMEESRCIRRHHTDNNESYWRSA